MAGLQPPEPIHPPACGEAETVTDKSLPRKPSGRCLLRACCCASSVSSRRGVRETRRTPTAPMCDSDPSDGPFFMPSDEWTQEHAFALDATSLDRGESELTMSNSDSVSLLEAIWSEWRVHCFEPSQPTVSRRTFCGLRTEYRRPRVGLRTAAAACHAAIADMHRPILPQ